MAQSLRILCTGDLHVGRRPSRVSAWIDTRHCSCAAAWADIVDYALAQRVDLVAVSGDLVDRENRFYEAYGPLEAGLRRLAAAGIHCVAVAGNHDFDVLPQLADAFAHESTHGGAGFRLLGRGGTWERYTLRRDGVALLHVDGWSFPSEHVYANPLVDYPPPAAPSDGTPVLGLLHGDLDQPQSPYAPVSLADLQRHPLCLWLLGHIHKPARHRQGGCPDVLYPGSPQGMDPGEVGPRGPWLVEIDPAAGPRAPVTATHVPLARVRYDAFEIDLADVTDEAAFRTQIPRALKSHLAAVADHCGPLELLACRLCLTGRTRLHRRLQGCCDALCQDLELQVGSFVARVEQVALDTRPAVALDQLARGNDPAGVLANLLLSLDSAEDAGPYEPLVRDVSERLGDLHAARAYQSLASDSAPDAAASRGYLARQGYLLLDALLAQREGGD